ncbi:hypothetical protein [Ureibacillus thermosphaericus]
MGYLTPDEFEKMCRIAA